MDAGKSVNLPEVSEKPMIRAGFSTPEWRMNHLARIEQVGSSHNRTGLGTNVRFNEEFSTDSENPVVEFTETKRGSPFPRQTDATVREA